MVTYVEKMNRVNGYRSLGTHAERICAELSYLNRISQIRGGELDHRLEMAADYLIAVVEGEGVISRSDVEAVETMLSDLGKVAKSYTELFIAHAHIDMNWMWGYQETAAITVDTFRTILDLMKEYPEMTYGQSQATTYEIIDKFCPEMLPEIKERIREGRWEVTAAEWVECDKNMPDGESLVRQILQSRKYLSKLLEIDPASLDFDFVPDTFGHNANVPEILANAGVKYMYHCRGNESETDNIYHYIAPSGKKVLVYREYTWYTGEIGVNDFEIVPDFCAKEGLDTYLCVFGVGDHGGGPSRRDIERILEYKSWPLTPNIRFGTYHEFFAAIEHCGLPKIEKTGELNFVFTGCYTTQSRIKMANRLAEARINETEALSCAASLLAEAPRQPDRLDGAWRNILFNHFHDIIPGSGTIETREYTMGHFQDTMACLNTYSTLSMRQIANAIDTSFIPFETPIGTRSEGAGAGCLVHQRDGYGFPASERGRGSLRVLHLFNTTGYDRDEYTEVVVWDYVYDIGNIVITDADGNELPFDVCGDGYGYPHHFYRILVKIKIPAFSYATVVLKQRPVTAHYVPPHSHDAYTDEYINDLPVTLENEKIRAVFDKETMHLVSLVDKTTGEILIDKPSCFFRYADENPQYQMTSWRVGPLMNVRDLNETCTVRLYKQEQTAATATLEYEIKFDNSVILCGVRLKKDSSVLEFLPAIKWNEEPVRGEKVPQISFAVPVSYKTTGKSVCDIPFGTLEREALAHDVPALSYLTVDGETKSTVSLLCDSKYGFRLWEDTVTVTLIRSAYDPDDYPERGSHTLRIGVAVGSREDVKRTSSAFNHRIPFIAGTRHEGILPLKGTALTVDGDVVVSCLKNSEDGKGSTVRLYDETGADNKATLRFCKPITKACLADSNETILSALEVKNGAVAVTVPALDFVTIVVSFS